jgi:hypothetical protein
MLLLTFTLCSTSQYSNIISQFIELNNELGNPREDVGVIISSVRNVINEQEKRDEGFFNELSQNCNGSTAAVNNGLTKLANDINESTKSLNEWKATLAGTQGEITKAANDIKATAAKFQQAKQRINKDLLDFKVLATETDQKLNVVKTLRDIITDELLNNKSGHSFVQLNKFTTKLAELKEMLNNDNDSLYSPLVSVLLTLASEQNFSDQGILKKILENINNLEHNLTEFRKARENGLNSELKTERANLNNLGRIKNAYENLRAQSFSKRIDAQHYIHFYTNEIAHFNAERTRKTEELHLVQKICAFEKTVHNHDRQELQAFKTHVVPYIVEEIQKLEH